MAVWNDITAEALYGTYEGYIRYADHTLSITAVGSSGIPSQNALRVYKIKENTHYKVRVFMQARFRLGCTKNLTSSQTIANFVIDSLDMNGAQNVGEYRELEITSQAGQVYLIAGIWASACTTGKSCADTMASVIVYEEGTDVKSYTVTFEDMDGSVLDTQTVAEGADAVPPSVPEHEGYEFAYWDTAFTNITADTVIKAVYKEKLQTHTVTFKDWDDTVLKTETVEHGKSATAPEVGQRTGYRFTGWDVDYSNVTEDITVTAQYVEAGEEHVVSFYEDTTKAVCYGTFYVQDGMTSLCPLPPKKAGYVFEHWDKSIVSITEDTDVYAVFKQALPKAVIRIYTAGGNLLQTIDQVMSSSLMDSLDGELTFDFSTLAARGEAIDVGCVAEFLDNFYNIVRISKRITSGVMTIAVSCEHISYVLNDDMFQIDEFDFTGSPVAGLKQLLNGTQFMAGTVEFTDTVTMKINQSVTRRAALMQYIAILGGEIEYEGNFIHIRKHRGNPVLTDIVKTRNVTDVSVTFESRAGTASYELALGKGMNCTVGDEIRLVFPPLGINTDTRIISMEYNPFHLYNIKLEVGDYKPTINDTLYQIEEIAQDGGKDYSQDIDDIYGDIDDIWSAIDSGGGGGSGGWSVESVDELPESPSMNVLYLLRYHL